MVWDLVPTLVTLAPGETRNLTCRGLFPEAWCFIKTEISVKIEREDNNIETIQVNGSLECVMEQADINLTMDAVPVCDSMLVYCINAPYCSVDTGAPSYTLGQMQRNPFYIHINENETCSNMTTPNSSQPTTHQLTGLQVHVTVALVTCTIILTLY